MHFNTYFNDGKGFIGISTSVGEHFFLKNLLNFKSKSPSETYIYNNGFNGWNTCDKLKTNLTQLLTRALAWRASWGCHLAPAQDVRLGTKLRKSAFHFNHGFPHVWISHQRFKTQDLKLSNRRNLSRSPHERPVRSTRGSRSENPGTERLPHGLDDWWAHGERCQRTTSWCMSRNKKHKNMRGQHTGAQLRTPEFERVRYSEIYYTSARCRDKKASVSEREACGVCACACVHYGKCI